MYPAFDCSTGLKRNEEDDMEKQIAVDDDKVKILRFPLNEWGTNAYILICKVTGESMIVDTPGKAPDIIRHLEGTSPQLIVITHGHMDHLESLEELRTTLNIPVAMHPLDAEPQSIAIERRLADGDTITIGKVNMSVLHTPGHTKGSICLLTGNYLLSGDTLFPGGPGRTQTPEMFREMVNTLKTKLFVLHDDVRVFPGHGEPTVISKEKREFEIFSSKPHDEKLCGDVLWLSS
jgi:hydroxyacylglutathione hydrolase